MNKSTSITKLAVALTKAQSEMPVVKMNVTNKFLNNKYADLGAVIETSRPILAKYELSISQFPTSEAGQLGVTSMLIHSSGEWVEDTILISATDQKGLSVAQSAGVIISYLRRYSWASILGLYADEDNDGHTDEKKSAKPSKELPIESQVPAAKKPNEIITDSEWETFSTLVQIATNANVSLPEYNRAKMNPSQLNGATQYIKGKLQKAGK